MADISQAEDSEKLLKIYEKKPENTMKGSGTFPGSFHHWLQNAGNATAANGLFYAFLRSVMSKSEQTQVHDADVAYIIDNLRHHTGNIARAMNDLTPFSRDKAGNNLNSLDFDEFGVRSENQTSISKAKQKSSSNES